MKRTATVAGLPPKEWPAWVLEANSGKPLVPKTFLLPIVPCTAPKAERRGGIRVLKIHNRFAKIDPALKKWPEIDGYERFNVCKNNRYQELSPMILGPVRDENGSTYANTIEDGWQCSKVWPFHLQGHGQESEDWKRNWNEWSRRGRFSGESRRHRTPKGKAAGGRQQVHSKNKNVPLFSFYMGEKLQYKDARKRMYMRWYEDAVKKTEAYKDLKARHMSGQNLLLLEFDGLDRMNEEENCDLTEELLLRLLDDDSRPFGHGLVLACCLMDLPIWRYTPHAGVDFIANRLFDEIEQRYFASFTCNNKLYSCSRGAPDCCRLYVDVKFNHDIHGEYAKKGQLIPVVRVAVPKVAEDASYWPPSGRNGARAVHHAPDCDKRRPDTEKLPYRGSSYIQILPEGETDDAILRDYAQSYMADSEDATTVELDVSWCMQANGEVVFDEEAGMNVFP